MLFTSCPNRLMNCRGSQPCILTRVLVCIARESGYSRIKCEPRLEIYVLKGSCVSLATQARPIPLQLYCKHKVIMNMLNLARCIAKAGILYFHCYSSCIVKHLNASALPIVVPMSLAYLLLWDKAVLVYTGQCAY